MTGLPNRPRGCQGSSCRLIRPIGMAHQGACHCLDEVPTEVRREITRTLHYYRRLLDHVRALPAAFYIGPEIPLDSFARYLTRTGWYPHPTGDLQHNTHQERVFAPRDQREVGLTLRWLSAIEGRSELAIYLDILEESLTSSEEPTS
jgi:hypothetical protein